MKTILNEYLTFDDAVEDSCYVLPWTGPKYNVRAIAKKQKELKRPLTDSELKAYER